MKFVFFIVLFPFVLLADINEECSELYCQYLSAESYDECEEVLDYWENYNNPGSGQIGVLRALSFLCKGEIESGKTLLDESLNSIPESRLSDTNKDSIRKIVEQFPSIASSVRGISYFHILDCKKGKSNSEVSKGECMNALVLIQVGDCKYCSV